MIKAVIFDMYETLITHFKSPLYFGTQMSIDAAISEDKFQELWKPTEMDGTIGKMTLGEAVFRRIICNSKKCIVFIF